VRQDAQKKGCASSAAISKKCEKNAILTKNLFSFFAFFYKIRAPDAKKMCPKTVTFGLFGLFFDFILFF